jgi:hypothetical protein
VVVEALPVTSELVAPRSVTFSMLANWPVSDAPISVQIVSLPSPADSAIVSPRVM